MRGGVMVSRSTLISLVLSVVAFSSVSKAYYTTVLDCPAPLHEDIESLQVWADVKSYSDQADMFLRFTSGTEVQTSITKEDVVEGYIILPVTKSGIERVLLLEENGWFVALFKDKDVELIPTSCREL